MLSPLGADGLAKTVDERGPYKVADGGADMGSAPDSISERIVLTRTGSGQGVGNGGGYHASGVLQFRTPNATDYPVLEILRAYVCVLMEYRSRRHQPDSGGGLRR
ncbi:hypothetical protein [Bradyrhizobium mercantei]|uniref:hypothetical protein n=1 Tax=Bradyrhizobium mercantei TaxID=1904807 RepID=UPI0011787C9D|nr:hypothetical protein [Bradyrhizobium mercantei]